MGAHISIEVSFCPIRLPCSSNAVSHVANSGSRGVASLEFHSIPGLKTTSITTLVVKAGMLFEAVSDS